MKGEKAAPNILQEIEGHSYPKYIVAAFASLFLADTRRQREPTVLFATWTLSISGLCRGVDRLLSPTGAAGRPGVLLLAEGRISILPPIIIVNSHISKGMSRGRRSSFMIVYLRP